VNEHVKIVRAVREDAVALTHIAVAAKGHWGYPQSWLRHWEEALTITPEYIERHPTYIATLGEAFVGFCALQFEPREPSEALLDHLWVAPSWSRRGIGRALFAHAKNVARQRHAKRLKIVGDPHAEGFYRRMGATLCGKEAAPMDGHARYLCLFELAL
jgi:GNAT superfamily N-acetyltransferase